MSIDNDWKAAIEAYSSKKYSEAVSLFSKVIAERPSSDNALFNRALAYYAMKDIDNAKMDLLAIYYKGRAKPSALELLEKISTLEGKTDEIKFWQNLRAEAEKQEQKKEKKADATKVVGKETSTDEDGLIKSLSFFKSTNTFADVIGMEEIKKYLRSHVIMALQNPGLYKEYGKSLADGLILYGPSGTGKTHIIRAAAGEANANVLIVKASTVMSMYVGISEKNVDIIWEFARKHTPCILFLDEIDALAGKRHSMGDTKGEGSALRMVINSILQAMDGMEKNPEGIFVVGSTNRPYDLDPAFLRSGRFNNIFYIRPPTLKERVDLFKHYLNGKPITNLNYLKLALRTSGYSQADIAHLCDASLLIPIMEAAKTKVKRRLTTRDIMRTIESEMPEGSIKTWFASARDEVIGKMKVEIVDDKMHTSIESGTLSPEEQVRYAKLVTDVKKQTSSFNLNLIKAQRLIAKLALPW